MKKIIITGSVLACVLLAPLGVKTISDNLIEEKISAFDKNGIAIKLTNSSGYFESKRQFDLKITSYEKLKDLLISQLENKNSFAAELMKNLNAKDERKLKRFVEGLVFKGLITNSNINPSSDIKSTVNLYRLADEVMEEINKDEESKKIIMPLLDEMVLGVNFLHSNKGDLKSFGLKNIDELLKNTEKIKEESLGVKVLGHNVDIKKELDKTFVDTKLDLFHMEINAKKPVSFSLDGLNHKLKFKDEFENDVDLSLNKFLFKTYKNEFSLNDISFSSKAFVQDEFYNASVKSSFSNMNLYDRKVDLKIKNILLDAKVEKLDYKSLQTFIKNYNEFTKISLDTSLTRKERRQKTNEKLFPMLDTANVLLNKGFSYKFKANVNDLSNKKLKLESLNLDLDANLKKNNLNLIRFNQMQLLGNLDLKANINMTKKDYKILTSTMKPNMAMMISMYAKQENDKVNFDILLDAGKIKINGKNLN